MLTKNAYNFPTMFSLLLAQIIRNIRIITITIYILELGIFIFCMKLSGKSQNNYL